MSSHAWTFIICLVLVILWGKWLIGPKPRKETQVNNPLINNDMNPNIKWFLWIDKTGENPPARVTLEQILELPDDLDWVDKDLHQWAKDSEPNDRWEDTKTMFLRLHR